MYFPHMNFGYTHKNKVALEKKKKEKKCTDFCDHTFEKIGSPPKSQKENVLEKEIFSKMWQFLP